MTLLEITLQFAVMMQYLYLFWAGLLGLYFQVMKSVMDIRKEEGGQNLTVNQTFKAMWNRNWPALMTSWGVLLTILSMGAGPIQLFFDSIFNLPETGKLLVTFLAVLVGTYAGADGIYAWLGVSKDIVIQKAKQMKGE